MGRSGRDPRRGGRAGTGGRGAQGRCGRHGGPHPTSGCSGTPRVTSGSGASWPSLPRCSRSSGTKRVWHGRWASTASSGSGPANRRAIEVLEQAARHAHAAGDRKLERDCLSYVVLAALHGPTPVPEALELNGTDPRPGRGRSRRARGDADASRRPARGDEGALRRCPRADRAPAGTHRGARPGALLGSGRRG